MFGKKKKDKGDNKEEDKEEAAEGGDKEEKKEAAAEGEAKEGEATAEGEAGAAPKKSKKKLIIIIIIALVVLGGAGAGVYFSGIAKGLFEKKKVTEEVLLGPDGKPIAKPIYYTLPDFLVNLNAQGKSASFLKATIILELARKEDVPIVEANLPRISDAFTTYLRELRPSDLAGSAGIQRLREELMLRVNKTLEPVKVDDVLFKEILVQ